MLNDCSWPAVKRNPTVPLLQLGLHLDLVNVYDPIGSYFNPLFFGRYNPAPRPYGPDGRDEIFALISLHPDIYFIDENSFGVPPEVYNFEVGTSFVPPSIYGVDEDESIAARLPLFV